MTEPRPRANLFVYKPGIDDDMRVVQWFMRMREDGDLDGLLMADSQSPSALLQMIAPPKFLFYDTDVDNHIKVALWGEQLMSGVFVGYWIRRDRRHSIASLDFLLRAYEFMLERVPAVMGVTKQAKLLKTHERLGYTILGQVPGLFGGEDAWIVCLTRDGFAKALPRFRRVASTLEG